MTQRRYVFVLEQKLGHIVHSLNICRVLGEETAISPTVIKVPADGAGRHRRVPGLSNWSVEASLTARIQLERRLRAGPVDAIFVHTQVAALALTRVMRRVPTVVSLDATPLNIDSMASAYNHRTHPAVVEQMKMAVTRRALLGAAAIVTWSSWAARSVSDDYGVDPRKVTPIHPGVDLDFFRPVDRSGRSGPLQVLFVGGDFHRKGGHELLAAAAQIGPQIEVDLVTPDPGVVIPRGAVVRVHRDVKPKSSEMVRLYQSADVFALPTRGDCLAMVIAEAMASGLPVVATNLGGTPDAVAHGTNGLLVAPDDADAIRRALLQLASDPQVRLEMGRLSRKMAEADHDAGANGRAILRLLDQVSGYSDVRG